MSVHVLSVTAGLITVQRESDARIATLSERDIWKAVFSIPEVARRIEVLIDNVNPTLGD